MGFARVQPIGMGLDTIRDLKARTSRKPPSPQTATHSARKQLIGLYFHHVGARCPKFTCSHNAIFATCQLVVSYDWSSTRYFFQDHLNSTNVVTDASGSPIEALDYYPYGSTRINQTTSNFNEGKQFIAQYSDPETNLSHLQARYYDSGKGEFLSEDPVFLGDPTSQDLTNPQTLNSYSYANDNPITGKDPTGRGSPAGVLVAAVLAVAYAILAF